MKILILGGTGAMGVPLTQILSGCGHSVDITTRSNRGSAEPLVRYLTGNAHDMLFLWEILQNIYDVVIDFMSYDISEFETKYNIFLEYTDQYVFISSARVFDNSPFPINEASPRLLDTTKDQQFLASNEYAISKAKSENLLYASKKRIGRLSDLI